MASRTPDATNVRPGALELSEKAIAAAKPGDVLRDAKVRGLHLRCFETKKVFYLYYRVKGSGVERRPQLGAYGSITLTQAREAAQVMLARVALGEDPAKDRADAKAEPTLEDLWKEFRKRHGEQKKTAKEDERIWNKYLQGLASKRLSQIGYSEVADLHHSMKDTPIQANRVLALLSTMLGFGMHPLQWIDRNPAQGVARFKEVKRKRYMTAEEAAKVAAALDARAEDSPASVAFIYLLILTGARCGEIAKARWSQLQGNKLVLSEHKTDQGGHDRVIYLPRPAMEVLDRLPRTLGTITGIQSPTKLWHAVRKEAECPDLRIHDLRHSFASVAVSSGLSLEQIGELLGHASTQTTKRYSHLLDEVAAKAAGKVAGRVVKRMGA